VTIGVGKVDPAPAIVMIDLARAAALRIGPMLETPGTYAVEDSVKIRFANYRFERDAITKWMADLQVKRHPN
jgi:hypothetical protein